MRVVAINGSSRKDGNTALAIRAVFRVLEANGIETQLIQLAGSHLHGCRGCRTCSQTKDGQCVMKDDVFNECFRAMVAADGVILGSPTYFSDVTAEMKALIDRAGLVSRANGHLLKYKAGAAVMAVRRGGAIHAFDTMNHFLHMMQMFLVGATYWNMVYGGQVGEAEKDEEGMANMKALGENMAWLLKKIKG